MTNQTVTRQFASEPAPSLREGPAFRFEPPGILGRLVQDCIRLFRRRRDRAHLAELPDYLLEDIGLTRADLPVTRPVGETMR